MELHTESRRDLCPDPDIDAIQAIFYSVLNDIPPKSGQREVTGVVILNQESASLAAVRKKTKGEGHSTANQDAGASTSSTNQTPCRGQQMLLEKTGLTDVKVEYVSDEKQLIEAFVKVVHR